MNIIYKLYINLILLSCYLYLYLGIYLSLLLINLLSIKLVNYN